MRVLHFSDVLLPATETFVRARLIGDRFESVAATWQHDPNGLAVPCPFVVIDRYAPRGSNTGLGRLVRGPFRVAARKAAILRVLAGARPDVVHAHFGTVGAAVGGFCRALRIPLVVSFYGFDLGIDTIDPKVRRAYQELFRCDLTTLTCEGPAMSRRLVEMGAPVEKIRLLPLSLPPWAVAEPPVRPARTSGPLRLLQVARFVEKKGVDLSLAAVARSRASGSAVSLTIVGDGPLKQTLHALATNLGIADAVRFMGYVPHDGLAGLLAQADVLIQPSRTTARGDTEGGHPTILVESLAQGVPVVGTRHADIPFVVREGYNGLLSDEEDVAGLAASLTRLAVEPQLVETLARGARSTVLRRHHPAILLRLRERIYREAIRRAPRTLGRSLWRALPLPDPFETRGTAR